MLTIGFCDPNECQDRAPNTRLSTLTQRAAILKEILLAVGGATCKSNACLPSKEVTKFLAEQVRKKFHYDTKGALIVAGKTIGLQGLGLVHVNRDGDEIIFIKEALEKIDAALKQPNVDIKTFRTDYDGEKSSILDEAETDKEFVLINEEEVANV